MDEENTCIGILKKTIHYTRQYAFFPDTIVLVESDLFEIANKLKELNNEN